MWTGLGCRYNDDDDDNDDDQNDDDENDDDDSRPQGSSATLQGLLRVLLKLASTHVSGRLNFCCSSKGSQI